MCLTNHRTVTADLALLVREAERLGQAMLEDLPREAGGMRTLLRSEPRPQAFPLNRALPPLETLLTSGGDARLHLDPSSASTAMAAARRRGRRRWPSRSRPQARFRSALSGTRARLRRRLARHDAHDDLVEETRAELTRLLGIEASGTAVVFAPSGTDAMLHALAVARAALGTPLVSILAAADETGSGASFAVSRPPFQRAPPRKAARWFRALRSPASPTAWRSPR